MSHQQLLSIRIASEHALYLDLATEPSPAALARLVQLQQQLKQHFGDKVYRAVIPRNVRLAEAPSFGAPVMYYDKSSTGAKAYLALAGEMLRRADKKTVNSAAAV